MISTTNFHFLSSIFILQAALSTTSVSAWQNSGGSDSLRAARTGWAQEEDSWNYWWSYSGVSGPLYWGLLNPDWFMCDRGRRQSPIDVTTRALIYDPNLKPLRADNNLISGILYNDGHSIVFNGSHAAAVRFSHLERHKPQAGTTAATGSSANRQVNALEPNNSSTTASGTATKSKRDTAPNQLGGEFVLVADANDFLDDNKLMVEQHQQRLFSPPPSPPLLMRELSNNIELSASGESSPAVGEERSAAEQSAEDTAADQLIGGSSHVHFSGGSSPYSYKFETLQLKFGPPGAPGSEHHINGRAFAAELQVFAYNWQLYKNYEEATTRPHGLMAISVLIDSTTLPSPVTTNDTSRDQESTVLASQVNEQLERLLSVAANSIAHRGHFAPIQDFNLSALLPDTEQFVSYEGSLTQPGCHESVVWLILNRPLYVSKQNLDKLRSISADEQQAQSPTGTVIAGNSRPVQAINNRPVRTNIRPPSSGSSDKSPQETCPRLWTKYEYK